jgi:uncharacterized delta-60 repeat protein
MNGKFTQIAPVILLLFGGLFLGVEFSWASAGNLDPSFGSSGITITRSANGFSLINAVRVQNDGKILVQVAAPSTNEILRYTTTGALDTSFGTNGIAPVIGGNMALAGDQIVVGAIVTDPNNSQIALAVERLNNDGSRDPAFANGGMALADLGGRFPVFSVVLAAPDGSVLMCASLEPTGRRQPAQTALVHFTSTGELDMTFGNQGVSIATAAGGCSAMALLNTGDILVVNAQTVTQFTSNGSVKSTVTGGPIVVSNAGSTLGPVSFIQADGDYLLGQDVFTGLESRGHNSAVQVLSFTETGSPDPTFSNPPFHYVGSGGSGIEALVNGVAAASNGDVVLVGNQITFTQNGTLSIPGLARLTPSGQLDTAFGNGGVVVNSVPGGLSAVAVQPADDKIVAVGLAGNNNELTISRYLAQ